MPGITGLITKLPREVAEQKLLRMVEALRHESFYKTGTWVDEALGIYVGWALREDSLTGTLPLTNETGDIAVVFSGEEFPEAGLTQRLQGQGHRFNPDGPSYLPHLFEEDANFLPRLNGRFHGMLVDRNRGIATLFNDRYGMHRLYFHESVDSFYFSAEAKAILAVRPDLRKADPQGLGEFVACGCALEGRSLFHDINVLPSAAAWTFRNRGLDRKQNYFHPREWEEQAPLAEEAYYTELREVFSRNLSRYFAGPQRIGMSVTGGLDTRMILAWQPLAPGSLPCYTFGGMFRECSDITLGRQIAMACQQPHQVIQVGKEFLSHFPDYAERTVYLSDGSVNISHSPDLYVNRKIREIAPVRMTGNYGGEVLRSLRAFKAVDPPPGLFDGDFMLHIHQAKGTFANLLEGHPVSFGVFRQAPWHHYGLQALEQTQVSVRTPFLDNDLVRTVFRAPQRARTSEGPSIRLISQGNPKLSQIWTDRGPLDERSSWLTTTALRGVIELLRKAEYAYDYGMPQWLARVDSWLAPLHLERMFLGRQKFYHFRVWYRDVLSKFVREILLDPRTLSRPYWNRKQIEGMVRGHLRGSQNHTTAIHKVLTLEFIHRRLLEGS